MIYSEFWLVILLIFYLKSRLNKLKTKYHIIKQVKGMGLMLGLELNKEGNTIYENCLKKRLLINCTHGNVLRIMPSITVKKKQIDKAIKILESAIKEI